MGRGEDPRRDTRRLDATRGCENARLTSGCSGRSATWPALSDQLDEDGQVDFKGKAKAFLRAYNFLSSILPYTNAHWEKLSIFLNFLVPKLPAPKEEDPPKGILEAIDMDSYRVEKQASMRIALPDADAEIEPVPAAGGGHRPEPELDRLSNIIKAFNDLFGNIPWTDSDRVRKLITEEIPALLSNPLTPDPLVRRSWAVKQGGSKNFRTGEFGHFR